MSRIDTNVEGKAHTIIGAGTLGRRIALMWITNGGLVHLFDSNEAALKSAEEYIEDTFPKWRPKSFLVPLRASLSCLRIVRRPSRALGW